MNYTAKVRKTPPPQPVLFSLFKEEPGGGRLASLAEPPGPQERIQRRTVEQPAELLPWRRSCAADCGPAGGSAQALRHNGA